LMHLSSVLPRHIKSIVKTSMAKTIPDVSVNVHSYLTAVIKCERERENLQKQVAEALSLSVSGWAGVHASDINLTHLSGIIK
jgi:hypothetical protein